MTTPTQEEIFVVRLAGPTGRGKSRAAKRVASRLNGDAIFMEVYSLEMSHLPLEQRAKQNYDAPNGMDVQRLESHIRDYAAGNSIDAPIYDFAKHLRVIGRRGHILAKSTVIVEDIPGFAFCATAPTRRPYLSTWMLPTRSACDADRSTEFIRRQYALPSKSFADLELDSIPDPATVEKSLSKAIVKTRALRRVR